MKTAHTAEAHPPAIFAELLLVVGLPLLSIMVGTALVVVSYLHGFADLATAH